MGENILCQNMREAGLQAALGLKTGPGLVHKQGRSQGYERGLLLGKKDKKGPWGMLVLKRQAKVEKSVEKTKGTTGAEK